MISCHYFSFHISIFPLLVSHSLWYCLRCRPGWECPRRCCLKGEGRGTGAQQGGTGGTPRTSSGSWCYERDRQTPEEERDSLGLGRNSRRQYKISKKRFLASILWKKICCHLYHEDIVVFLMYTMKILFCYYVYHENIVVFFMYTMKILFCYYMYDMKKIFIPWRYCFVE